MTLLLNKFKQLQVCDKLRRQQRKVPSNVRLESTEGFHESEGNNLQLN